MKIYLTDRSFTSDVGIVDLHPAKGTHWIAYINENFFNSYGAGPPQNQSRFLTKQLDFVYTL